MNHITLISDWQLSEPYVAMLKGRIISQIPDVQFFDLTHTIDVLNVNKTAFLLKSAYSSFPEGTVHLILTGVSDSLPQNPLVMQLNGHYFIGIDNGILPLMFPDEIDGNIREFTLEEGGLLSKMISLARICLFESWETKTELYPNPKRKLPFSADYFQNRNLLNGMVVYIDDQSNVLTNIPVEMFRKYVNLNNFKARIGTTVVTKFHEKYVEDDEPYFLPNSLGVMEIAVYSGRLAILARWQKDTSVEIECDVK